MLAVILQNFLFPTMGPRKLSVKDRAEKKKRMMCIELKKEMIKKNKNMTMACGVVDLHHTEAGGVINALGCRDSLYIYF
ncbi:MAG: hypothetical protein ACRC4N_05410 [Gammaproteobacteria bacterium]